MSAADQSYFDQYEHYNFTEDNKMLSGNSGRLRTKKVCCFFFNSWFFLAVINNVQFLQEAELHTNRNDPSGHSRKIVTKMINTGNLFSLFFFVWKDSLNVFQFNNRTQEAYRS